MVTRLARIAVRYPWQVLAVWGTMVVALAIPGLTVQKHLVPATLFIPGTQSNDWKKLMQPNYGSLIAVTLNGPGADVEKQGRRLARDLSQRPLTRVLSPWSPGAGAGAKILRPTPGQAVIALDVKIPPGGNDSTIVPPLEKFIDDRIDPPVTASPTGDAPLGRDLNDAGFEALHQGELIAAPILIFVLLMVFRSPIAAAIPLVIALGTVGAGYGVLRIFTNFMEMAIMAMSLASMIGLALGVDYALLIVSRYREALDHGMASKQAATLAANTAGRTAVFAATVLSALMIAIMILSPGSLLLSAAIGAIIVTILGVLGGVMVCPAALTLLGPRVNKWQIGGKPKEGPTAVTRIVRIVGSRPVLAAAMVGGLLLLMASPVLALKSIPPDPHQLPKGNPSLVAFEKLRAANFGPNIDVALREPGGGAITSPARLAELNRFQEQLRRIPLIKFVSGPGDLADRTKDLRNAPNAIKKAKRQLRDAQGELNQRTRQIDNAKRLAASERVRIQGGLGQARNLLDSSKRTLADVNRQFGGSFGQLVNGLAAARDGTRQLRDGTILLKGKAAQLRDALRQVRDKVNALRPRIDQADKQVHEAQASLGVLRVPAQVTERELQNAWAAFGRVTAGNADPAVQEVRLHVALAFAAATGHNPLTGGVPFAGYQGLDNSLAQAAAQAKDAGDQADDAVRLGNAAADVMTRLADGSSRLVDPGLSTIVTGLRRLADGLATAHDKVAAAAPAVDRLQANANAQLSKGQALLDQTAAHAGPLLNQVTGQLNEASNRIHGVRNDLSRRTGPFAPLRTLDKLEATSPFFFRSPYVVVAGLQGARPYSRVTAENIVDSSTGGNVGHIVILPNIPTNDPKQDQVVLAVRHATDNFRAQSGMDTAVGGSAAELYDYKQVMKTRLPLIIFVLCLVTYLMLVPILRSIVLPAIAIGLNLLTVAVSFGFLTLFFVDGVIADKAPLGGAGAPDVVAVTAVFSVVFALSIDYYVFLLTRMREEYVRTQSNEEAVRFGIEKTAKVVTGAALIMLGVFAAFATANFAIVRQLGLGLTIAIAIDATLVRLALLPALMRSLGDFTWYMPEWLEEHLPEIDVEGAAFEHEVEALGPSPSAAMA